MHNSRWVEEQITIDSVHEHHNDAGRRRLTHYFIGFHDEMLEALAESVETRQVRGTMRSLLIDAVDQLTAA